MGRSDQRRDAKGRWASEGGNIVAAAVVVTIALAAAGTGFSPGAIGDARSHSGGIDRPSRTRAGHNESDGGDTAGPVGQDLDGNDLDGNDLDGNDLDGNDLDGNDLDGNDLDGNDASGRGDATTRVAARLVARVTARLARGGLRALRPRVRADTDCVAHSYGQVQQFLRAHPCVRVYRALFDVSDRHGSLALLAVAWVEMPTAELAQQLRQLMDSPGTGNITDLSREQGGPRFTGEYYASALENTAAVNAQAQPVGRGTAAIALARRAADRGL